MPKLVAGAQGRTQGGQIHPPENRADAASPAVDAGGTDLPQLVANGVDQLAHDDTGLLDVRLPDNPAGGSDRYCGTRGWGRGHETWPDLRSAMNLLVMIRVQVRVDEVLRNPLRKVVCRKIGKNAARGRSNSFAACNALALAASADANIVVLAVPMVIATIALAGPALIICRSCPQRTGGS